MLIYKHFSRRIFEEIMNTNQILFKIIINNNEKKYNNYRLYLILNIKCQFNAMQEKSAITVGKDFFFFFFVEV